MANWRPPPARLVSLWTDADRQRASEIDAEIKRLNDERSAEMEHIIQEILQRELAKLPEEPREPARAARETKEKERTTEQAKLSKEYPSIAVTASSAYLYDQKRVDAHQKKFNDLVAACQAKKPPEDYVQCLTEVPGQVPVTKVFYRGDHRQLREAVKPSELPVLSSKDSDLMIDPLGIADMSPLRPLFQDEQIEKVFHAAEYDLVGLKRDYGFKLNNLFDTMAASRILGYEAVGLGSVLEAHFGIKLDKRQQRANLGPASIAGGAARLRALGHPLPDPAAAYSEGAAV